MQTLRSGLYRFSFDPRTCEPATERLDDWVCYVHDRDPYWIKGEDGKPLPAGDGRAWAEFYGAHDLEFCPVERMAPVPLTSLTEHEVSNERMESNSTRHERRTQLLQELMPYEESNEPTFHVDLGKDSMRGMAGIILPGPGASYSWLSEGVSLSWRSMTGTWVPLGGKASYYLTRWGDNIYTNEGNFDVKLFNELLEDVLPGWVVDESVIEASAEACVFLTCVRDIYPSHDSFKGSDEEYLEQFGPIPPHTAINPDYDERRFEFLKTPLSDNYQSYQTKLIGTRAVLVWGNSD